MIPNSVSPRAKKLQIPLAVASLFFVGWQAAPAFAADAALPAISVKGTAEAAPVTPTRISSGALGERADIDTPFSIKAVTVEEIEDRQAASLGEILKYDASVLNSSSSNNEHPATVTVRGLRIDNLNGYKVDGMANVNRGTELPLEMFERVEVLKGLGGFLYGFGAPGGVVNYITKRPTDDRTLGVSVGYDQKNVWKEHVDAGGRFGTDDRFGYRLNLVNQKGDTIADSGSIDRTALGLALDARLTRDLTLNLDAMSQSRKTVGGTGITINTSAKNQFALPSALGGRTRLNSNGVLADGDYQLYTLGASYRIASDWKANVSYRESTSTLTNKKDQLFVSNTRGDYEDRVTASYQKYLFKQWQAMVEGRVELGGMTHQIVFGAMQKKLESDQPGLSPKISVGNSNLYNPATFSTSQVNYSGAIYNNENIAERALFASDTVEFNRHWSALAGLRYTEFEDTGYASTGAVTKTFTAKPISPTVALMYKPLDNTTVYASYSDSLEPTLAAPVGTTNAGTTFPPTKSKQFEFGVKTVGKNWSASAAVFDIRRGAVYQLINPNKTTTYYADGLTANKGFELSGSVRPTAALSFESSLMVLRSTMEKGLPTVVGNRTTGAPRMQAGAQAIYEVPGVAGLSVRTGLQYVGRTDIDPTNINTLPGYTLLDAGLNYRTRMGGHMVTWRANVTNLTARKYWLFYQDNALNVGAPRTLSLGVRVDL